LRPEVLKRFARAVILPLLLLSGVLPGGSSRNALTSSYAASDTHTLMAGASIEGSTALQPGVAASVAHLGIAPRQAWQSRHDQLRPMWDVPLPASAGAVASAVDSNTSYLRDLRTAVTGSLSFRATSLPPPAL
jgi:hypothetical protein